MKDLIYHKIEELHKKYGNVIQIFGGATLAYDNDGNFDFEKFISALVYVPSDAKFWKWHAGISDALRTFCNICMVDPGLVEAYIGQRFDKIRA